MDNPYDIEFPDLTSFIEKRTSARSKLKICIATEDIVGPIRNGGIGTTYTYLSRLLAREGHDVTILYLRGDFCENETIEHWVDYYAKFSVKFVPLYSQEHPVRSTAPRWIAPMYSMYAHLKEQDFDVVHVSEWHGSGYHCLLAKRLGLAFQNTTFCVKTSSPWLWNREYGFHTIKDLADLPKIFAERRSVELADIVIGGSRHLLCWMIEHGYEPPKGATHVQQNVVVPLDIDALATPRRALYGKRVPIKEIVFFGRLEYRKGLDVFCDAIDILLARGVALPTIYLMGKYGERIPSYPEFMTADYIQHRSSQWPMKIEILDDFNTEQALTFLLGGDRLAVMPSIIENSTLAVYETAYYGIPFIASDRGGTPELVLEEHRQEVLVEPHPIPVANSLVHALEEGGFVAAPSFSNARNLEIWRDFHHALGAPMRDQGVDQKPATATQSKATLCLPISDNHQYAVDILEQINLQDDASLAEVLVIDNGSTTDETKAWLAEVEEAGHAKLVVERLEPWGEQHAQNHAASRATGDMLVFPRPGSLPKSNYFQTICTAASYSTAGVFCTFFDEVNYADRHELLQHTTQYTRVSTMVEDHTSTFFDHENFCPVIAVRKSAFELLGGFRDYGKVPGADNELVSCAALKGVEVTTLPEALVWRMPDYPAKRRVNRKALPYRSILPYLENAPKNLNQILMTARGFTADPKATRKAATVIVGGDTLPAEDMILLYGSLSRYPKLRKLAIGVYGIQTTIFGRLLKVEAKTLRGLMLAVSKLRRRLLPKPAD